MDAQQNGRNFFKVGRLEVLDGHGSLRGQLWEPDGRQWKCRFKKEHLEILKQAWMREVKVNGREVIRESNGGEIEVDSIQILAKEAADKGKTETYPFWETLSIEELARIQGVKPFKNLDEIADLWPADDDPDELLEFILSSRAEDRRIEREKDKKR